MIEKGESAHPALSLSLSIVTMKLSKGNIKRMKEPAGLVTFREVRRKYMVKARQTRLSGFLQFPDWIQ